MKMPPSIMCLLIQSQETLLSWLPSSATRLIQSFPGATADLSVGYLEGRRQRDPREIQDPGSVGIDLDPVCTNTQTPFVHNLCSSLDENELGPC